jgi:predicted nucleic acid-binding protein
MIVVADSSPLIVLVNIDLIEILPALFKRVTVPLSVADELVNSHRPSKVRDYFSAPVSWLDRVRVQGHVRIPSLHPGETEALNLAKELRADYLLVDERRAYQEAIARHIKAIGTLRVLELAAGGHLIDLAEAFDRLRKTDFWISERLLAESLRLHLAQQDKDSLK